MSTPIINISHRPGTLSLFLATLVHYATNTGAAAPNVGMYYDKLSWDNINAPESQVQIVTDNVSGSSKSLTLTYMPWEREQLAYNFITRECDPDGVTFSEMLDRTNSAETTQYTLDDMKSFVTYPVAWEVPQVSQLIKTVAQFIAPFDFHTPRSINNLDLTYSDYTNAALTAQTTTALADFLGDQMVISQEVMKQYLDAFIPTIHIIDGRLG